MAIEAANLIVKIGADTGGLDKGLAGASKSLSSLGSVVGGAALGGMALLASGAVAAGIGLASTIAPASNLSETVSKIGIIFGGTSSKILEFGKTSATALGMSNNEALAAAGVYGNLFRAMDIGEGVSSDMSIGLVKLAADLASFNNIDPSVALDKLRAGLSGETEPLKTLGVNLNEAVIKQKAFEMGLYSGEGALSASAKAQASYALIMKQTGLAQGDFARTSEGLANQQRITAANFENIKTTIGTALLPVMVELSNKFNTLLASAPVQEFLKNFVTILGDLTLKAIEFISSVDWEGLFSQLQTGWLSVNQVVNSVITLWQGLQPVFQAVGTVINAVIGALTPIFQNLFSQIQGGLVNLNPMIEAFKGLWTALQPVISAVANVLGVVLVAAVGILSGVIGGLVNAIQPWITMIVGIVTGFVTMLTGYINVIVGLFTGDMNKVRTGGEQIFSGLKTVVESLITGMINTATAFISGFVTTFLGFFTKLGVDLEGTVTGIVTNVVKWFSDLPGKMVDVGKSIIQGIIDGIGQMIGALLNTLGDVADKIRNAVTGALNAPQTNPGMGVPGKAIGGSVFGGSPYIVGERGPELFVPGASGTIIPNNKLSTGGTTINLGGITISGNADASTVKQAAYNGVMAAARAMGAM